MDNSIHIVYTRRQINLYRLFFADFSVNCQPLLSKFCNDFFRATCISRYVMLPHAVYDKCTCMYTILLCLCTFLLCPPPKCVNFRTAYKKDVNWNIFHFSDCCYVAPPLSPSSPGSAVQIVAQT